MADTYTKGRVIAARPSVTTEVLFYTVPAVTEIDGVLRICNQDTTSRTYSVAHTVAGHGDVAANGADFLCYDKIISANDTNEISIEAGATETIRIKASIADKLSFTLEGVKKVTS